MTGCVLRFLFFIFLSESVLPCMAVSGATFPILLTFHKMNNASSRVIKRSAPSPRITGKKHMNVML